MRIISHTPKRINHMCFKGFHRTLMIRTLEEEDKVVRWAFAEIMGYLKEKHGRRWFKYNPSHVRVHKIMYSTFESANIPVTRSWYRYGCFIHSNQLAAFRDFSSLKNRYLGSAYPPKRLQSAVTKMDFDVTPIIEKLRETVDAMPQRMNVYLKSLYQNPPREFGNIYLSKLELHNALRDSTKIDFRHLPMFYNWLKRVRKNLSVFHMSAFSRHQFNDLTDIVMNFTSNVEEALLKIEELIRQEKRILKKRIKPIYGFPKFFDEQVWVSFALEISARTVKGFREVQIRNQQLRKKKEKILELTNALKMQSAILAENDLVMSWDDYRKRLSRSDKDRAIAEAISEMERIYEGPPESE